MAPRVPWGDSGFFLTSSASAQRGHSHAGGTLPTKPGGHPASPGGARGRINLPPPPKSRTWRGLESFIKLAEVGDEPQAVGLCHGGHLGAGEDGLDAQLLLRHVQYHLVGPDGILEVHGVQVPAGRHGCHQGGLRRAGVVRGGSRHSHQVGAEAVDEGAEGQAAGPGAGEVGHLHAAEPGRAGLAPPQQLFVGVSGDRWGGSARVPIPRRQGTTPPSPLPPPIISALAGKGSHRSDIRHPPPRHATTPQGSINGLIKHLSRLSISAGKKEGDNKGRWGAVSPGGPRAEGTETSGATGTET